MLFFSQPDAGVPAVGVKNTPLKRTCWPLFPRLGWFLTGQRSLPGTGISYIPRGGTKGGYDTSGVGSGVGWLALIQANQAQQGQKTNYSRSVATHGITPCSNRGGRPRRQGDRNVRLLDSTITIYDSVFESADGAVGRDLAAQKL